MSWSTGTGIKKGELVIIATDEYAKKNPHVVEKFFAGPTSVATTSSKANPKQAGELIASDVKLTPEQFFPKVLPKFGLRHCRPSEHVEEFEETEIPAQSRAEQESVDIDAFVDTRYLKASV